jgi:hypothetical protein
MQPKRKYWLHSSNDFQYITPIYTINEASFQRLHLNFVLPQEFESDPSGARTQDPNIKSVVLYQLS